MTNLLNTTLGQYQIVALLGEGGMATVYKAWQPSLRRYVALKVLAPHLSHDAEFVQRFHQEAVSAANLRHNNIVTIHDVGTESGYHYIAMESIEGASLQKRIRSGQAFTPQQVVDVISQIGSALDYAHQRGFIHRDIKPANILMDPSGRAVLTDFGIVKALSGSGLTAALTQAGKVIGTPHYMSPEQVKDEPLDHRSDLYSLGIVCYEMLAGQVPFGGNTTHAILYAQVNTSPPPLRQALGPAVPPAVEAVVGKMLAKEREKRYNSGGEFARDLAQAVSGVRPAGVGGEAPGAGRGSPADTELIGRTPGGVESPAMGQPVGAPTVAEVIQPLELPALPPVPAPALRPAPARRSRWSLLLVGAAAAGVVLIVGAVLAAVVFLGQDTLADAQAALAAGDYTQAVEGFNQVLERDPDNVEALGGLLEAADDLAQAGQFDGAIAAYEAVRQVKPGEIQALRGLGQAYEAQGEWEEAAVWYEKWTQAAPEDGSAFLALGDARFNLGEFERTVAEYERAEALGASSAEVNAHLGLAYYELARYDEAVEYLQNGVGQNPEDFQLQRALGMSLYAQDQLDQAAEHLNKAIALGADRPGDELLDVYYALGGYYFGEQDHEQAVSFYEQAQALDPEGQSAWADEAQANLDQAYIENAMQDVLLDLDFSNIVTEGDETYAIAKTGQRAKIEGAVHLVEGPWKGSQALVVEEGTTNLTPDPVCTSGDEIWYFAAGAGSGDIGRYPDTAAEGGYYKRSTFSDCKTWTQIFRSDLTSAVSTGIKYSIAFRARSDTPRSVYWMGQNSDGGLALQFGPFDLITEWKEFRATTTASTAPKATQLFMNQDNAGSGWVDLDWVQLEQKAHNTTLCYGDKGNGYSWVDTPYDSPSSRTVTGLVVPSDGNLNVLASYAGSLVMWFRLPYDSGGAWQAFGRAWEYGDYSASATSDHFVVAFDEDGDSLATEIRRASDQSTITTGPQPVSYSAGDWTILALVWDSTSLVMYWNGGPIGSISNPNLFSAYNYSNFHVGAGDSNGSNMSNLTCGTITTFDRALTANEVAALCRVGGSASK